MLPLPGFAKFTDFATLSPAIERRAERYRLGRLREQLLAHDLGAVVLFDAANIRFACGARNMQLNTSRNPARYVFVPAEGPVVLFDYAHCEHLAAHLDTVDEIRLARPISPVFSGAKHIEQLGRFVAEIDQLMQAHAPGNQRIAIERSTTDAGPALTAAGYTVSDATWPVELAKAIKSADEIQLIRASVACTEAAVAYMEAQLRPGITEQALWAEMHHALIAGGGEYIETRLFNSGNHTNPWFQETSQRVIGDGELVALDTDAVGCYGYYTDFSRTFIAGDRRPSPQQRQLYALAYEQLETNLALLRPGIGFRDFAEGAWPIPEDYIPHRYMLAVHGCGLTGEYPFIAHDMDWEEIGYDGIVAPGMTLCVESFIGHKDGGEGVKLEEHVLVTETGVERLSGYGYADKLLPTVA